ncbi:hypothetical protein F4824DRAFT_198343 [Ustulina deusta]|nr:hypothetical protein F4824DRAFT_198343 [Ustulina deusta]
MQLIMVHLVSILVVQMAQLSGGVGHPWPGFPKSASLNYHNCVWNLSWQSSLSYNEHTNGTPTTNFAAIKDSLYLAVIRRRVVNYLNVCFTINQSFCISLFVCSIENKVC